MQIQPIARLFPGFLLVCTLLDFTLADLRESRHKAFNLLQAKTSTEQSLHHYLQIEVCWKAFRFESQGC